MRTVIAAALLLIGVAEASAQSDALLADRSFGNAKAGADLIKQTGCGKCHTIPGIDNADALVGPPLDHMARRVFIAGMLRNTPDNMTTWLLDPQAIVPGNAMPDLKLTPQQARDVTAYLYTLK